MTVKELISDLLDLPTDNLDMEVKIYGLISMDEINKEDSEYEFIEDDIEIDNSEYDNVVYISKRN